MEKRRIVAVDGDIVAYRCASSCEPTKNKPFLEDKPFAIARMHDLMSKIFLVAAEYGGRDVVVYLSGEGNFRKIIDPMYKAHRTAPSPTWLADCQADLYMQYETHVCTGYEADDALGISATENDAIVASIDKDLMQIPGIYFDFVKEELHHIDRDRAEKVFWTLMLTGDRADNIEGIYGIGPKKAEKALSTEEPYFDLVRRMYSDDDRFFKNYNLVRVIRTREELEEKLKVFQEETNETFISEEQRT